MNSSISVFWFRRDLRLEDNAGLSAALKSSWPVLPLFVFDDNIIDELAIDDARISFIYSVLQNINTSLEKYRSSISILKGDPVKLIAELTLKYDVKAFYFNRDYEPYARNRDEKICKMLEEKDIACYSFKDQVIFEENEILKADKTPYTVFTPYSKKWLSRLSEEKPLTRHETNIANYYSSRHSFPHLKELGFKQSCITIKDYRLDSIEHYAANRNYPWKEGTSLLGPYLRFGTVSIRQLVSRSLNYGTFLNELIWREFFMQILYHFPSVVSDNFRRKYDGISWRNREDEFESWCKGETGFPLVDAGMRELNKTGYMHNRVRMVCAGFLCKHLLIDWRWGEAYFAEKLLDYELASNNGNWQWAAGTGCDAAPYFRVFNPSEQLRKFDRDKEYVRKWIPELDTPGYPDPIVDHSTARERALETYSKGITERRDA